MRHFEDGEFTGEQPIIIQPEIGYLGIICREINGVLHFLMQAKIESGNVNCVKFRRLFKPPRAILHGHMVENFLHILNSLSIQSVMK